MCDIKMANKRTYLKTCCIVTALIFFLLILTAIILYFTVLKPKKPRIVATAINIANIEFRSSPTIELNLTLSVEIVVNNRNYAGFSYDNTTTMIFYHGEPVVVAPVGAGTIDARSTEKISGLADVDVSKVVKNRSFLLDILTGSLNFTSSSAIEGKVVFLEIFKLHASSLVTCDISVFVFARSSRCSCNSKTKL